MGTSLSFGRGGLIVLPVHLHHRGRIMRRMVLDTGSRFTIIRPDVAGKIGLELREVPGAELVGVVGSAPVAGATVDEVELLGYTVPNVEVICLPLHPDLAFGGVIGANLIRHFNIWIDNDAGTVTFEPCEEVPGDG
jgi:predicted aspartyl protease